MKKIILFFLFGGLVTLTGCLDVIEEIHLNRNGSGKYALTFDMSSLFTDPFMKGMMEEALKEGSLLGENGGKLEKDTVIYMKNLPEAQRRQLERPELWDKVVMRMTMSESRKEMRTTIELDFDKLSDIDYLLQNLNQIGDNNGDMTGAMLGDGSMFTGGAMMELKGKRLSRLPSQATSDAASDEDMQLLKMFLTQASYKTIYHLPGKVKKVTIPNAQINGNDVVVENSYLDVIEGKAKMDGQIRFK